MCCTSLLLPPGHLRKGALGAVSIRESLSDVVAIQDNTFTVQFIVQTAPSSNVDFFPV
jgi:hypothetical protein